MTDDQPRRLRILDVIAKRADALLDAGTLVFPPSHGIGAPQSKIAYAFVVPVSLRDDLADALADLAMLDD